MSAGTSGIHHVTAISGGPQRNLDFYAGVLGTRLVKRTVNFDDPGTYHLYYGDGGGTPGTIMTFFPWEGAAKGRIGAGQVITTAYSIPATSLGYWTQRLVEHGVRFEKPKDRFGDTVLAFEDPDGLRLEIVAADDRRVGYASGPVPAEHSIRGFHHAALAVRDAETTTKLMTDHLGFRRVDEAENRVRLAAGDGAPATWST
jgi:glyoxalase family protein